jgi:hypothetical protein
MGLPVPGIFLYKEADTGRHHVVDGQQRLRTLQYFYSGLFLDRAFRLVGVREEWEGKTYSDLETSERAPAGRLHPTCHHLSAGSAERHAAQPLLRV